MVSRMGQEWPSATPGMPGIIELELGRSGKKFSEAGVVSRVRHVEM